MISYTPPRHLLFKCMFTATTDSRSLLWRAILSKPFIKWWSISHTIGKLNEYTNLSKTSITYYEKKIQQLYGIVAMLTKYLFRKSKLHVTSRNVLFRLVLSKLKNFLASLFSRSELLGFPDLSWEFQPPGFLFVKLIGWIQNWSDFSIRFPF